MSGGKETPRQKLIGMMYLVLTALLALQVSSAILDKFDFLNESLVLANNESMMENSQTVEHIKRTVEKDGNGAKDLEIVRKAEEVKKETSKLMAELDALKEEMVQISGGRDPVTKHYLGGKEETKIESMMIGATKNGKGYALKARMNKFCDYLSDMADKKGNERFRHIALDAKEIDKLKNTDQGNKDFSELNFGQTPMVAALAVISQKQSEITRYELQTLEYLASKVGAEKIKFDKIVAMVMPESKYVAAGTKYKARMFIAASSSSVNPTMIARGNKLNVVNGFGEIEFVASASNYDDELKSKQNFKGEVKMTTGSGDTTFTVDVEYFVTKPVISIQSAALSALYMNCGNELNVQVPALGNTYAPSFTATGATTIRGAKTGFVTVVPNSKEVALTVSSSGNVIGTEKFKVRAIPRPEIVPYNGSKPVNLKMGESATALRSLTLKAEVSDKSFVDNLPKDARFRVTEYEISLARGSRAILQRKVTDPTVNLNDFVAQAKPGDRLVIEVKKVERMNFRDEREDVPISASSAIINIPLN
jgi:gliding motility-associated protein GldM